MSDLISRQAAIDALNGEINITGRANAEAVRGYVRLVKDRLERLPSAQPKERTEERVETHACDLISRQALCEYALNQKDKCVTPNDIMRFPSAQPERKMGKWIYNSPVTMKCDQCGFVIKDWDWHRFKFCPNCDCDMRGEQE